MQAAFDAGTHAVLAHNSLLGCPPMRINDAEISPGLDISPVESIGFTDMSFSCMTYDALKCWRKLIYIAMDSEGHLIQVGQEWAVRSQTVKDLEQILISKYLQYCDLGQPFHLFTKLVGDGMIVTMRLLERRPLCPFLSKGPHPEDDFDVLTVATEILERGLVKYANQDLDPWSWFAWAKWYALAVVLAELCGPIYGSRVGRGWIAAEASFASMDISNSTIDEALWKSIKKLMVKARAARDGLRLPIHSSLPTTHTRMCSCIGSMCKTRLDNSNSMISADTQEKHGVQNQSQPEDRGMRTSNGLRPSLQSFSDSENNGSVPHISTNESEAMSLIDWDLFVQDVFNNGEPGDFDSAMWEPA